MKRGVMAAIGVMLAACSAPRREPTVVRVPAPTVETWNEEEVIPFLRVEPAGGPAVAPVAQPEPSPTVRYSVLRSRSRSCPGMASASQVKARWTSATIVEIDVRASPGTTLGQTPPQSVLTWNVYPGGALFTVDVARPGVVPAVGLSLSCPRGAARVFVKLSIKQEPRPTAHVIVADL